MTAFTIDDITDAIADGPVAVGDLVDEMSARTRLGDWDPDFAASLNHAIYQGRVRFVEDGCTFEHSEQCVLEATS